jgi:hypothetical protein
VDSLPLPPATRLDVPLATFSNQPPTTAFDALAVLSVPPPIAL